MNNRRTMYGVATAELDDKVTHNVQHVSYSRLGGAGAVAVRLTAAQKRLGWHSELLTMVDQPFPRMFKQYPILVLYALMDQYLVRNSRHSSFFSLLRQRHHARTAKGLETYKGILHLHWLPGFLPFPGFFEQHLQARKMIWSVQDLWLMTGGCHYTNGCTAFTESCRNCPQVRGLFRKRVAAAMHDKQATFRDRGDILLVAPSEWTRSIIQASTVTRDLPTAVIPNPIDTAAFSPLDRATIRKKWDMAPSALIIGVGAADLDDERKQIPQTLAALSTLISARGTAPSLQVLIFGAGGRTMTSRPEFRFVGPSKNTAMLAEWYNAMDVYISLSRYETFGNTLAEAAACGTPSICLTGSGMSEVVIPDRTGRHVPSPAALPAALSNWIDQPEGARRMGLEARENALCRFDDAVVARQFIDLYERPSL